ncbi:MAG: Ig-like domain-containing protein [Bacteroidota bacterium]
MKKNIMKAKILFFLGFALLFSNCSRDKSDDATPATFPKNGNVYIDGFSSGLEYLPFGDSFFAAFSVDEETKYAGASAMRFDVPNVGNPDGAYAGAIFPDYGGRDLSGFDALTFWAKATQRGFVNEIGFGQDFRENKYQVLLNNLELTTNWKQYTIAIPDPSKLTEMNGLFWYAEGPENDEGYTFWVDEVQFEKLGTVAQPRPAIFDGGNAEITIFAGVTTPMLGLKHTVNLGSGQDQTITVAPAYYEFTSSNPNVATVNEQGMIMGISSGETTITATLGGVDAAGSVKVNVLGSFVGAPVPTEDPSDVISIFSDAYTNVPVDYYNGYWAPYQTTLGQDDLNIAGDNIIAYTELNFVGIQFLDNAPTINASSMTHLHLDIQAREDVQPGDYLIIRVVDVGPDNTFGNGDDSSGEITLNESNLVNGQWYSLDVAFSEIAGLTGRSNLAQVVFVSDATISSIYVDNIYFYNDGGGMGGPTGPAVGAPAPTQGAADVISVFSDAYTNVDANLNPDWGQATQVSEISVAGNNTLRYGGLNFQGLELASSLNVSGMEFLHIDYWTDNSTALNAFLISTGPNETASALSVPTTGWASVDIALSEFSMVDLADVIQFKFDGNGDIYLDNIYFWKTPGGGGDMPTVAAPMPTQGAADVLSVFSDAYTNIDANLNPNWGQGTQVSEVSVAGNNTLMYAGLDFQGLELIASQDVSSMEFLHLDFWTANSNALSTFLISPGPNETAYALSVPTAGWASVDIALSEFSMVDLADVIQFKFEGNGDIYLDNIYFWKGSGGGDTPTSPAPTPTQNAADVISMFSNVYTDVGVDTWKTDWSAADFADIQIMGDDTKLYTNLDFVGIETTGANLIDASSMTHFRVDIWTPNMTTLKIKLVDFGPDGGFDGGDDTEHEIVIDNPAQGQWISYDIPLSDFTGLASTTNMAQLIFASEPAGGGTLYVDNVYFYKQ